MASRHLLFKKALTRDDVLLENLLIPPGKGREYFQGLPLGKTMSFWDNKGESWSFFTFRQRRIDVLSGEWKKFVESKDLKVTDIVSFELEGENEPRFYVHVSPGVPAEIQSAGTRSFLSRILLLLFIGAASLMESGMEVFLRTAKGAAMVKGLLQALVLKGANRAAVAAKFLRSVEPVEDTALEPEGHHGKVSLGNGSLSTSEG